MKQILIKIVKIIVSDVRQAAVPAILFLIVGGSGGLIYLYRKALSGTILVANTPTPLWATIALVLLCCVYTYAKVEKFHSSLNQSKFYPPSKTDINIRIDTFGEKVLLFVSENPELETDQITSSFPGSEQRALFNLQELEKSKFITHTYVSGSDMMGTEPRIYTWSTINLGLAYLNQHGLIK